MKAKIRVLLLGLMLGFATNAHAWFFIYIPTSLLRGIGDAITSGDGDHCVSERVAVGSKVTLPNGSIAQVKSLSGTSSKCTDPNRPIRAALEPLKAKTSDAKFELPDSWEAKPLSEKMRAGGTVLYASDRTTDSGLIFNTYNRSDYGSILEFAKSREAKLQAQLTDARGSEITPLRVNGVNAYRFQVTGTLKQGTRVTYLSTVYEGQSEMIFMNIWTTEPNFKNQVATFTKIADSLTGIGSSYSQANSQTGITYSSGGSTEPSTGSKKQKLIELKSMLDEGLITQDEYDSKRAAVVQSL